MQTSEGTMAENQAGLSCLLNSSFKVFERPPFARYNYNWKDNSSHGEEQTYTDINCKVLPSPVRTGHACSSSSGALLMGPL